MILHWIADQFKHPRGFAGKIVGAIMTKGNMPAIVKTLELLQVNDEDTVLEIGFGPGSALYQLLGNNKKCTATGIDFSLLMLHEAAKKNHTFIDDKRLKLIHGDFCDINLQNNSFSKVFGVNVIYFWNDLDTIAHKIHTLLKPNGKAVFFMADKSSLVKMKFPQTDVFNKYDIDQVESAFRNAGFSKVWHDRLSIHTKIAYIIQAERTEKP